MTTIALFSSIHGDEMQKKFGWDDGKSIALFDQFRPDLVCGEVRQSDYESSADYQGPSEYRRYIFDYCKERGIPFLPCDYFRDEDIELAQRPIEAPDEAEKEFEALIQEFFAAGAGAAVPFNSREFNDAARRKQEFQYKYAPEVQRIIWNQRNREIVKNIAAAAKENPGKNILVIFGAEHTYWLAEELGRLEGVEIRFPAVMTVTYAPLTAENFHPHSLDGFVRRQHVRECWRRVDGALVLRPVEYIEDWTLAERREFAAELLRTIHSGGAAFGAFCGGEVAGFAAVAGERLGSRGQYADLSLFYVSEPFRGQGIGGTLFAMACAWAKKAGAQRLYISAHSAREVIAAYRALGCVEAEEIDPHHAAEEPCDVQMECRL